MRDFQARQYIYLLKAFAIFSVVCAHTAVEPQNGSQVDHVIIYILNSIGTMGVPIFFIISGYLYFGNERTVKDFWRRKCRTVVIPWFFCESIVWLYVVLRKGGITFTAWLKYILGINNTTYYLTVLILFYALFWRLKAYKAVLIGSIILSGISLLGLGWGNSLAAQWNRLTITPYLNIFNWMAYFALGMLLKKKECLEALAVFSKKILPISVPLLVMDLCAHYYYSFPWTYFSKYAILNITLQVLVVMGICYLLSMKRMKNLAVVGEYSYTIYLLHGLGAGGVVWITARIGSNILILARPVIVILLVLFGIWIVKKICERLKFVKDVPKVLIGLR